MSNNTVTNGTNNQSEKPVYINHLLSGAPIVYIYNFTDIEDTGGTQRHFFKGSMKSGDSSKNNYISVQGSLSPHAREELDELITIMGSEDSSIRTVGVKVVKPRIEGTASFLAKCEQDDSGALLFGEGEYKRPASALVMRLHNIESYKIFGAKKSEEGKQEDNVIEGKDGIPSPEDFDDDIPF